MGRRALTESVVGQAARAWLNDPGYVEHLGPAIPDALVPKLMSGEIQMREVDRLVGHVT